MLLAVPASIVNAPPHDEADDDDAPLDTDNTPLALAPAAAPTDTWPAPPLDDEPLCTDASPDAPPAAPPAAPLASDTLPLT
jgi:hypothetical protein